MSADEAKNDVAQTAAPAPQTTRSGRNVKKVAVVNIDAAPAPKEMAVGNGTPLEEIPNVSTKIRERKPMDPALQAIHRLVMRKVGARLTTKKHLLAFAGVVFKDDADKATIKDRVASYHIPLLKDMCFVLDMERSGNKEDLVNRLMDFFENPRVMSETTYVSKAEKREKEKAKKEKRKAKAASSKPAKKAKKAAAPKKTKTVVEESDDSSDDEPLLKPKGIDMNEVEAVTRKILADSDLSALSMKALRRSVASEMNIDDDTEIRDTVKQVAGDFLANL